MTSHLQQAAVNRARASLEGLLGVHQRVFGVEGGGLVWLHMLSAVGGGACEAGADGGLLDTRAYVTPHHFLSRHKGVGAERVCAHGVRLQRRRW